MRLSDFCEWDAQSVHINSRMNIPSSPGQWSQETLTPGGDPLLQAPPCIIEGQQFSYNSNLSDAEGDSFSVRTGEQR